MARVISIVPHRAHAARHLEVLRALVVAGCAMALILARGPLPF